MKNFFIPIFLMFVTITFGQKNYYKPGNDSIYSEVEFKRVFEKSVKNIPFGFILIPTIYHKYIIKDSIINYVLLMAEKAKSKSVQSKFEFVFKQDSLFLLLNKKLPEFKLKDFNGKTFSSSQLIGKPTLINFWSLQCSPCIAEFPQLSKLKEKYGNKVNFIAISENSHDEVIELLNRKPFNFYQLIDGYVYKKQILKESSIPKNIFLDKNGYVCDIKEGLPFETNETTGKLEIKNSQLFEKIIDKILIKQQQTIK
jgi:cytochrome c biogenesis protein CcmG/thiol:disulfide interchange protein DsbE